jgi:hypothetical protein
MAGLRSRSGGLAARRMSEEAQLRRIAIAAATVLFGAGCSVLPIDSWFGPSRLDEHTVRAFAECERSAWIAHDYDSYYGLAAPEASYVSVRWNADGSITREKRSPGEARKAAEEYFRVHPGKFSETDTIDRVEIASDGRSAKIVGHAVATIEKPGKDDVLRAATEETIVLRHGRLYSLGQTDTAVR